MSVQQILPKMFVLHMMLSTRPAKLGKVQTAAMDEGYGIHVVLAVIYTMLPKLPQHSQ